MAASWGMAALGTFVLAGGSAALASPQGDRTADRRAIVANEQAWGQAYVTGDVRTADRMLDKGFIGVDTHGALYDKAQALAAIRGGPTGGSDEVGEVTVRFYGDTAIAQARETEVGPAPEFKPAWRVFTDTWIKRDGRWRIVAAEDLDPGAPTAPDRRADQGEIRALRARSNQAIAAHDLKAFTPVFAEDAVFVWSNGSSAVGRAALEGVFAKDFVDPAFVTYVRSPAQISVSETGLRAVEHGTWTAIKREPRGETRYGGDYAAHWFKGPEGWRIRGELYVKLRCEGALCTP